jgi:hypothetical protein
MRRRRRRKNIVTIPEEFDKTQLVEKELVDKISLWMLRMILNLGGAREFIDKNNCFMRDQIAYFLEVGNYVNMDGDAFKRSDVIDILQKNLTKLEQKKEFTSSKILTKNILHKRISTPYSSNGVINATKANNKPVKNSKVGCSADIFCLHFRHFPPKKTQDKIGIKSKACKVYPQLSQCDLPEKIPFSLECRRYITTPKKLPMIVPKTNKIAIIIFKYLNC